MRERQRDYDAKCHDLAEHFLDDYELSKEARAIIANMMAAKIQAAADWFCREKLDRHGTPKRAPKVDRMAASESFPP